MRKRLKKILSILLVIMVLSTSFGLESVRAEDGTDNSTSEETSQEPNQETELEYDGDENTESADVIENNASSLNYFYVESPYLETSGTQNIVLSWGDGSENVFDMRLVVTRDDGSVEEWNANVQQGQLYLFTREYTDDTATGIYTVNSFKYFLNGEEKEEILAENEETVVFGVNKEYDGYNPKQSVLEEETTDLEDTIETSVLTINEDGSVSGQESIAAALEAVEAPTAETAAFSSMMRKTPSDIVVALDAGHDNIDAGAQGNGLREEELTLKIANYCKAELETYPGVRVHMTRTGAGCPVGVTTWPHAGACIKERVRRASEAGAQIFVSMHLNSSVSSAAKGAEIIIPNNNWKPELGNQGRALAEKILSELVSLGLTNRGVYYKNSDNGSTYDDGSVSDYFSVQNWAKEYGLPGIIVEHAFISNGGGKDAELLKSEAGLRSLGVADAVGIANYLGLIKGGEWRSENGKTYFYIYGNKVYGELRIGNGWYYFDEKTGEMATGWTKHHGKQYYYGADGSMVHGETVIDGHWYYFDEITGVMATGWTNHHGKQYYYGTDGRMVKGETVIDGHWYYFDEITGVMATGWIKHHGKQYYYGTDGRMVKGETVIDGFWYYFDETTGVMATGWTKHHGKQYYYGSNGCMLKGRQTIDNAIYYFDDITGVMYQSQLDSNNVYYGPDGKLFDNLVTVEGSRDESIINKMVVLFKGKDPNDYKGGNKWEKLKAGGAASIEEFARICYEEATAENIRPELIFCQAMLETGYLNFHGDVKIEQFNFAGLGATGNGVQGEDFSKYGKNGVRMGLRAQVQHMKAYASSTIKKNELAYECVDGRFDYVQKGCAPYVQWLGKNENPYRVGWATGVNYGFNIWKLMKEMDLPDLEKNGLVTENGKTYFYENGQMVRSKEAVAGGAWRWFDADGTMAVNKDVYLASGNKWVRYNKNGEMVKGWDTNTAGTYYFDLITGEMYKGVRNISGKYYYFMKETGIKVEDKAKEACLDGAWRWFDADTTVAVSKDVYLPAGNKWVRYNENAEMVKGWDQQGNNRYYFELITGEMLKGWHNIDGRSYYFDEVTGILR